MSLFLKTKKNVVTPNIIKINSEACRVWKLAIRGEKFVNMNFLKCFDLKNMPFPKLEMNLKTNFQFPYLPSNFFKKTLNNCLCKLTQFFCSTFLWVKRYDQNVPYHL